MSPGDKEILEELHGLMVKRADGALDAEEHERLEMIVASPSGRSIFARYMIQSASLRKWAELSPLESDEVSEATERTDEVIVDVSLPESFPPLRHSQDIGSRLAETIHWQRHKIRFNSMTAVLTALAWVGFSYFIWFSTTPDDSRPNPQGEDFNFVAYISGVYEYEWAEGMRPTAPNSSMAAGEKLALAEGFIEITFYDGAIVVLEGPSEFVIDSSGAGTLEVGRLAATVPPRAVGFTIDTPSSRIVDLGTQFGVFVTHDGVAEVVVMDGRVVVSIDKDHASGGPFELWAGESLSVAAKTGVVIRGPARPDEYVLSFVAESFRPALVPVFSYDADDGTGAGTPETLAVDSFVTDQSGASNDGTVSGASVATIEDDPFDVPGELSYSFAGASNRINTNATDLLSSEAIVGGGGFTMDVWIKTDGVGNGGSAKIIDYGGWEKIRLNDFSVVDFTSSGSTLTSTAAAVDDSAWHHVIVRYAVTDGSNLEAIVGDLSLTVDNTTNTATGFVINSHAGTLYTAMGAHPSGAFADDDYQGLIYNPSVSLGIGGITVAE